MSELHIPFEALRDQINSAIDVIVQIDRFADGRAASPRSRSSPRTAARRSGSAPSRVRGRPDRPRPPRHRALPPLPAARRRSTAGSMLMGVQVPAEFAPRPSSTQTARADGGVSDYDGRAALLLLLLGVDRLLGLIGLALLRRGSSRRAALAARGRDERRRQRRAAACVERARRAAAAHAPGRAARRRGSRASGGPLSPVDAGRDRGASAALAGSAAAAHAAAAAWSRSSSRSAIDRRRPALVRRAARAASAATRSWTSCPTSRGCSPTAPRPGSRSRGAVQMAARELDDPAGAEMRRVVEEMRVGQPLDDALERLQRAAAVARGRGADDDDRDPAARRRRHRARAAASWARRSRRARTCCARSARCCPASCSRPTSSPASASRRSC